MVHSVVLLIVLVVLMPYAALIPMPTIAAILFIVAYNMCQWRTFVKIVKTSPKTDILVLVITCLLTVVFDLVVAIEVGLVITFILFVIHLRGVNKYEGKALDKYLPILVISTFIFALTAGLSIILPIR